MSLSSRYLCQSHAPLVVKASLWGLLTQVFSFLKTGLGTLVRSTGVQRKVIRLVWKIGAH